MTDFDLQRACSNYIYALDKETGIEQWSIYNDTDFDTDPFLLYTGNICCYGAGETMYGFNSASGQVLWKRSSYDTAFNYPLASDDYLCFGGFHDDGYHFHILNAYSGEELWSLPVSEWTYPCLEDNVVFVGRIDGYGCALDASSGKELWAQEKEGDFTAPTLICDNRIFFTCADRVYALDAKTGMELWRLPEE